MLLGFGSYHLTPKAHLQTSQPSCRRHVQAVGDEKNEQLLVVIELWS